jgi:lipid II:glycine glycyltransferase (peptidoglycan interpeptide bridge formation enzyme)
MLLCGKFVKTFTLKGVQTIRRSTSWMMDILTPLNVNSLITLATHNIWSYKQARQQQRTGTHKKQKGRTSMTKRNQNKEQQSPWKQVLTPEDGQIGPKHVVWF